MSFTSKKVIDNLVETTPAGELIDVKNDLVTLTSGENLTTIDDALERQVLEEGMIVSGNLIASKINKDDLSPKFWDHIRKRKFNIDLSTRKAIDFEPAASTVTYPAYFEELIALLEQYGQDHYPSEYAFTVVPDSDGVKIIIIGQKLNKCNFYTGIWRSVYSVNGSGTIDGHVKLDIHYYEDGNVRLEFNETTPAGGRVTTTASAILNYINKAESEASLKIINDFTLLNQKSFKNLRRLLPVTKSKINWGKAIWAYRLGSDVVNKK